MPSQPMNLSPYLIPAKLRESNIAIDVQLEPTIKDVGDPTSPRLLVLICQGFHPPLSERGQDITRRLCKSDEPLHII